MTTNTNQPERIGEGTDTFSRADIARAIETSCLQRIFKPLVLSVFWQHLESHREERTARSLSESAGWTPKYGLLEVGDVIREGDEVFNTETQEWQPLLPSDFGQAAGIDDNPIRRRIDAAPSVSPSGVEDGYYLASFKRGTDNGKVLWWMPNNCGYSSDLEQAGIYKQIDAGYHDNEYTVPVPVSMIRNLRVRRVVDYSDSLNTAFHSASKLRAAIAAMSNTKEPTHAP